MNFLSKGLEKMAQHRNERDGKLKRIFAATSMLLTVNYHPVLLERALMNAEENGKL
jgi:hypothetical protein